MHTYRVWVGLEPDETVMGTFKAESLRTLIATIWFLSDCEVIEGSEGIHQLVSPKGTTFWVEAM